MSIVEVTMVFWDSRHSRWDAQGNMSIRTNKVETVHWYDYSNYLGYDVYRISFYDGREAYTGPNGKDLILNYME